MVGGKRGMRQLDRGGVGVVDVVVMMIVVVVAAAVDSVAAFAGIEDQHNQFRHYPFGYQREY